MEISNLIDEFYVALAGTNNPFNAGINTNQISKGTSSLDYKVGGIEFRMQFLSSTRYTLVIHIPASEDNPERNSTAEILDMPYSRNVPNTAAVIISNLKKARNFIAQ